MPIFLSSLVPVRWQAGPLDGASQFAAGLKPESLGILGDSPFNAIVVNWSAGRPEDSAQQAALAPLITKAKASNIAVIGLVKDSAAGAVSAGLAAVISDKPVPNGGLPVITPDSADAGVVCAAKALWPRVPMAKPESGGVETGPTGVPWVDSNGWVVQMMQARTPAAKVWLMPELPKGVAGLRTEQYQLAVADAAAYGARWVVTLEPSMREGVLKADSGALESWRELHKAIRFFDAQPAHHYSSIAKLLVVSDFAGPNGALAGEIMNLCGRRHLQVRAVETSQLEADVLRDAAAVLLVQTRPPGEGAHKPLAKFLEGGGLVIAPASLAHLAHSAAAGNYDRRYDLYSHGKGRYAIARKPWTDPYAVAVDAHLLMSRKQDLVRLWNAGATSVRYTGNPAGPAYVQVVNYTARAMGHPMSAWVSSPFTKAGLRLLNGKAQPLAVTPKAGGAEVSLPPFPVYASIEFRG